MLSLSKMADSYCILSTPVITYSHSFPKFNIFTRLSFKKTVSMVHNISKKNNFYAVLYFAAFLLLLLLLLSKVQK